MKMLLPLLLLVLVSQHALAPVVEVYVREKFVLLPFKYSGFIPEDNPTVLWTRNDLNPKSVHLRREETDDLKGQNQRYRGRTSMKSDALDTLDFSLNLTNPEMNDSGTYTCSIGNEREELKLTDIQLHVKDQQVEVKVEEGSDSVTLPCNTTPDLAEDTTVEWTHSDQELTVVQVYSNKSDHLKQLDNLYCGRGEMKENLLRTGDLRLTLKYPTKRDSGGYICTIYRGKDILRQKVVLQVKEPFSAWATVLLVLLVLLGISGGLLFHFRHYFMSVYKVEVDSGVESVLLPCKTTVCLPGDAKVVWRDSDDREVYVYENSSDQPEEQDQDYRDRTKINEDLLKTGDLSLTLKHPTERDSGRYRCRVYGKIQRYKTVLLRVKVSQHALAPVVEVYEGEISVLLPCEYSGFIPEDSPTVLWTRNDLNPKSVHLRREETDDLKGQHQRYRGRTSMRPDALDILDFSLTLRNPRLTDSGNYTCSIRNERDELKLTDIQLHVKDQQVEVEVVEGSDSVILPCNTTPDLPEDTRVEWMRFDQEIMMVHEYSNGSDRLKHQDDRYCDRTKMNEDLLRTGDLSLTLNYPTDGDSGGYICTIYRDKDIQKQKVVLQVKEQFPLWATALLVLLVLLVVSGGLLFYFRHYLMAVPWVGVDSGVESVQLICKTTVCLPKDAKVEWKDKDNRKVHVYENGSDQPEEQDDKYKNRTKMKRNLLEPGDLSLTLKHPTDGDNSTYTCTVYSREGNILLKRKVELKVRGQCCRYRSKVRGQTHDGGSVSVGSIQ
ncbi:uncharacterized protein LOC116328660 isoform X2 [Oreochromis aureus]|uniref:uncharacterized protein LOC116328660 isoform X2 n=1 Tax=Oreochromis aureus TaxID=47969 RepID=UPI001954DECD|nr:uncharacterized protein LOC116328660 isoform X2 [Oreochromis aureus]